MLFNHRKMRAVIALRRAATTPSAMPNAMTAYTARAMALAPSLARAGGAAMRRRGGGVMRGVRALSLLPDNVGVLESGVDTRSDDFQVRYTDLAYGVYALSM